MRKLSLIFILLFGFFPDVLSQNIEIREGAYDFMLKYEAYSFFKSEKHKNRYMSLFSIDVDSIPNDILPDNNLDIKVSFNDYTLLRSKYCIMPYQLDMLIDSMNLKDMGDSIFDIDVYVQKRLNIEHFNSDKTNSKLYTDTLRYRYKLKYADKKYIVQDVTYLSGPRKYLRLAVNLKRNDSIWVNGELDSLDDNAELFLIYSPFDTLSLINHSKDRRNRITKNYSDLGSNHYKYKRSKYSWDKNYRKVRFRNRKIKIGFEFSNSEDGLDIVNINTLDKAQVTSYKSQSYGITGLYSLGRLSDYICADVRLGLNQNEYNIEVIQNSINYSYNYIDTEGDSYTRKVYLSGIKEVTKLQTTEIPFGLQINYSLKKNDKYVDGSWISSIYPYGYLGGIIALNNISEYNVTSRVEFNGQYESLFGYTFKDGFQDFGVYEMSGNGVNSIKKYNFGIQSELGLIFDYKNEIFLKTGLSVVNFVDQPILNELEQRMTDSPDRLNSLSFEGLNYNINILSYRIALIKRI